MSQEQGRGLIASWCPREDTHVIASLCPKGGNSAHTAGAGRGTPTTGSGKSGERYTYYWVREEEYITRR